MNAAIRRRWQGRRNFAHTRDWLATLYDSTARYSRKLPIPGRGRVCAVHLADDPASPLYLRLGSSDGFVLEEIFVTRVYDPVTRRKDLGPIRQIIDLGANAGFSVRLWRKCYPDARIIAVEPDPGNFRACQRNVGSTNHVQLVQACIAAKPGQVYLDRTNEECAFTMTDQQVGEPIEAITLPMLLDRCAADPIIDILKVDIEGAECEMFANCSDWIARVRTIMIELHPPYTTQNFLDDLAKAGANFKLEWTGETAGNALLLLTRAGT
jgi:FkbM family methyltransferase